MPVYEGSNRLHTACDIVVASDDGRYGVRVSPRQLKKLLSMCSESRHMETGGVLIGRYNRQHNMATVTRACGPPPDSRRGRSTFVRGTKGLQHLVDRLWRVNEYYLGEWHFHPGGTARPSAVDVRQMRRISESEDYHCPEPVLIVLGGRLPANWEMSIYVFPRGQKCERLRKLSP